MPSIDLGKVTADSPVIVQISAAAHLLLTTEQQNDGTIYFITDES